MAKITLIGPGAIGSTLAAWLSRIPAHEITIAARTPFSSLVLDDWQRARTDRVLIREWAPLADAG